MCVIAANRVENNGGGKLCVWKTVIASRRMASAVFASPAQCNIMLLNSYAVPPEGGLITVRTPEALHHKSTMGGQ